MPKPLTIDAALIAHLGELARIRLSADRQDELRAKLQQLVSSFSSLAEVEFDTDGAPDARTVTPDDLRPDSPETPPTVAEVLANAPQSAADCFVVARVIEP